ncbi:MAG: sulfatase-like hydrolase/transferase, partial [Bifidobacteriaceae bacterium]|nr:sulfatase-like hydrolase/transferase [Bifidobacteriaceae bacterium]
MTFDRENQTNANGQEGNQPDSLHATGAGTAPVQGVPVSSSSSDLDIEALITSMGDIAQMQSAQFVTDDSLAHDDEVGLSGSSDGDARDGNGASDASGTSDVSESSDGSDVPEASFSAEPHAETSQQQLSEVESSSADSAPEQSAEAASAETTPAKAESTGAKPKPKPSHARRLWKRPVCRTWWHILLWEIVHIAVFVGLVFYALWIVQSSVYPTAPKTHDPQVNSAALFFDTLFDPDIIARAVNNNWDVFTTVPVGVAWLNVVLLAGMFLFLIFAINRFWIAAWSFITIITVYAVANSIKVEQRNSTIVPSDLNFLSSGDGGKLMSFVPDSYQGIINHDIRMLVLLLIAVIVLNHFDCRRSCIAPAKHRRIAAAVRVALCCLYVLLMGWFASSMLVTGTLGQKIDAWFDDQPALFDSHTDAQVNGAVVGFVHLLNNKVMDKPADYSQATMEDLAARYSIQANAINASRTQNMTDSTVITILSESFTDPTRVPGTQWNEDPVPYLHQLKQQTTSGLMLSSGYGGGTANMEYMSLTGMALSNFAPGLSTPYQQLVPGQKWAPSFNQMWQQGDSIGIHPFFSSMYGRKTVYKKFGFRSLRTVDNTDDPFTTSLDMIDQSVYVSDAATYKSVLAELADHSDPEFISVMTMQNHLPYSNWYNDNQFHVTNAATGEDYDPEQEESANTYAKGLNYSDQALQSFLGQLNQLDRPVTVIWYGDHYPSVFTTANADPANTLALHETDYFIWSNAASASAGTKLSDADAAYTSSNFFMAQAAEHMNAKVSPYLAFLTQMHQQIAAMGLQLDTTSTTGAEYLDAQGNPLQDADLTDEQRQLLNDYKLIQYDVTAGKGYL